jgi:hypothetical protein
MRPTSPEARSATITLPTRLNIGTHACWVEGYRIDGEPQRDAGGMILARPEDIARYRAAGWWGDLHHPRPVRARRRRRMRDRAGAG